MSPRRWSPTACTKRLHRPAIFDLEMERIFEKVWIYCGHETQVPNAGDYYAVQIGRQPMIMVRGADGSVHVLYNRCPHRGVQLVGNRKGNTGERLRLLVPRLELPPRRQAARDPAGERLRGHAHEQATTPTAT